LVNQAKVIKKSLQKLGLGRVMLENSGNIGKNYRRHDEIGTPLCITVDFETLENNSVTVRDRDTMQQKRLSPDELKDYYEMKVKKILVNNISRIKKNFYFQSNFLVY